MDREVLGHACVGQRGYFAPGSSRERMFREVTGETPDGVTLETRDLYMCLDPRWRRSGYRLGRLIARQQLLSKIAGVIAHLEARLLGSRAMLLHLLRLFVHLTVKES
ncbi:hypothetical protein AAFF_G00128150 [Aldrovandia affinis]|uniref:Uncharacterized protein n=1 Tax=Aldrovandia affinis TaxID=143900 RepID=A0AAD7T144_9TELE|nr:hypothetical protein AAFF_G00128150 [Aldrovandia affinis]